MRGLTDREAHLLRITLRHGSSYDWGDDGDGVYEDLCVLAKQGRVTVGPIREDDDYEWWDEDVTALGKLALQLYDAGIR